MTIKVQLGPFVGMVNDVWLEIYYNGETSMRIAYKKILKHQTPLQALSSWIQVDNIVTDMFINKLIKNYNIDY